MFDQLINPNSGVHRLSAAIDELLGLSLNSLPRDELLALTRDLETQRRRFQSVDHGVIAELAVRGVATELSVRDTRTLLSTMLHIAPDEAAARVRAAENLGPRRGMTGEQLGPLFPQVATKVADGAISERHARIITSTVDSLPHALAAEHGPQVETFLTDEAIYLDPRQLANVARRVRDTLDPDGTLSDTADHERRRDVRLGQKPDGSATLTGTLTPWLLAGLHAILDPLARPHPATEDGARDSRSAGQRYHDALQSIVDRLLRSGTLPDSGGTPATILLTMNSADLERLAGLAHTGSGGLIPVAEVIRQAGDAKIIPIYLTESGGIAALGHTRRFASSAQRLALAARDRGCSHPGCDIPPDWCQTHHIVDWRDRQRTTVDELTLVCTYHHLTAVPLGWDCVMIDAIPHWRAPDWIDPHRTPIRNTVHHLDRIPFGTEQPLADTG